MEVWVKQPAPTAVLSKVSLVAKVREEIKLTLVSFQLFSRSATLYYFSVDFLNLARVTFHLQMIYILSTIYRVLFFKPSAISIT